MRHVRRIACTLAAALVVGLGGCDDDAIPPPTDAGATPGGLTPQQASRVVAKVGEREITLGEVAATLERMDPFDRLRYQTPEKRRELLRELIDVELLAEEARKRGLDKSPETQAAIRQILRDAMLAEARSSLPTPSEIPAADVKAYYDAHLDEFNEPERRRLTAIVVKEEELAKEVLEKAIAIEDPKEWGELFYEHSIDADPRKKGRVGYPLDLAGDRGIVGPVDDPKGGNERVPPPVRKAVFELKNVGDVLDRVIKHDDEYFVVRMTGLTAAHKTKLEEADKRIRVRLLQEKLDAVEAELEAQLRKEITVEVDADALSQVKLPNSDARPPDAPTPDAPLPSPTP